MERKSIVIDIPDGMCIDESNSTFEKIVFKKKDTKPRSWEEYCCQQQTNNIDGYCINNFTSEIKKLDWGLCTYQYYSSWKNVLPSEELAEAFLAMMQLMSLRQAWICDWKPDFYINMASNWCIEYEPNPGVFIIENHCKTNGGGLSFPTREMTKDFMNYFKDLLEIAKPLI